MSASGVAFWNAFCAGPASSPRRSALLTGQSPHENGIARLAHRGFRLIDARERDRSNASLVETYLGETDQRPFFLSFGLLETHRPFPAGGRELPAWLYAEPFRGLADTAQKRRDMAEFLSALVLVDDVTRRVIRAPEINSPRNNTVTLVTADHGPALLRMKANLDDIGIGTSVLLHVQGVTENGGVPANPVSQVDLYPSVCQALNVTVPERTRGVSVLPVMRTESDADCREVFSESNYHAAYEPARCVKTDRCTLIQRPAEHRKMVPANVDGSPAREILGGEEYFYTDQPVKELYDLLADPRERTSPLPGAAGSPLHKKLDSRLTEWMVETSDRFLDGEVPKPAGARLSKPDAWSATEETYE